MKKIIALVLTTGLLFAQTKSDIALTSGYNKFDDPAFLKGSRYFVGIRGGIYQDNGFGYQLGFEKANGANCQGLNLTRIYANGLFISKQSNGFNPYGVLSGGYEMSNIEEHKPDQVFIGAGVGVRKGLSQHVNGFVETRVLRKLKSNDTDIITTLGLAYALENNLPAYPKQRVAHQRVLPQPVIAKHPVVIDSGYERQTSRPEIVAYVEPLEEQTVVTKTQKHYYVQLVALASTNPDSYLTKLYLQGIDNAEVKEVNIRGRNLSLVVVGPFNDREEASQNLRMLKRVSKGAFITKL